MMRETYALQYSDPTEAVSRLLQRPLLYLSGVCVVAVL